MKKYLTPILLIAALAFLLLWDQWLPSLNPFKLFLPEPESELHWLFVRIIFIRPIAFALLAPALLAVLNLIFPLPRYGRGWKKWLLRMALTLPILLSWLKILLHLFAAVDWPPLMPNALELMNGFEGGKLSIYFVLCGLVWYFTSSPRKGSMS